MADILGESSAARTAGPARTASESAARVSTQGSGGGGGGLVKKKGNRGKGVKISLDEFQAGAAESGGGLGATTTGNMHGVERSGIERSNAPAWGRNPRASAPVVTSDVRMTPPSLSAIMTDERSRLKQQSESAASQSRSSATHAQHASASGGPAVGGGGSKGGRAWGQTQDLSEIRQAVIDEALFQRASQLPDIRPTGYESSWGRTHATEAVSIAKIEDIQMEEQARRSSAASGERGVGGAAAAAAAAQAWAALNNMPRRASLQQMHAANVVCGVAETDTGGGGGSGGAGMASTPLAGGTKLKGEFGRGGRGGVTSGRASGRAGQGRGSTSTSGRGEGSMQGVEEQSAQGEGGRGRGGKENGGLRGRGGRGGGRGKGVRERGSRGDREREGVERTSPAGDGAVEHHRTGGGHSKAA